MNRFKDVGLSDCIRTHECRQGPYGSQIEIGIVPEILQPQLSESKIAAFAMHSLIPPSGLSDAHGHDQIEETLPIRRLEYAGLHGRLGFQEDLVGGDG